jgi:hypothetical protein
MQAKYMYAQLKGNNLTKQALTKFLLKNRL